MLLRQMKYFLAVADCKSFSEAAEQCFISQSAQLDVLHDTAHYDGNGDLLKLNLQGYAVSYNKLTGEYIKHRIYDDKAIDSTLASRWDWTHEEWGRNVKREVNRILKVKKVTVDAPRMSKL